MPRAIPLQPRKSPRQARSTATVDAILEAAARILERDGPARLNTNAVAERAGVSVGSLYQYFPNKDAIVSALLSRDARAREAALREAVASAAGLPLEDGVGLIVDAAVAHQSARPRLARWLDREEARLPLDAERRAIAGAIQSLLAGFLARHRAALGGLRPDEAILDLFVMARALIDALSEAEVPERDIRRRARRAALGYLAPAARAPATPR
jgi:AcrR family transcriptional regulator